MNCNIKWLIVMFIKLQEIFICILSSIIANNITNLYF